MSLHADGEDKRLIMLALAEFSDQCEPGPLTPACPFFVITDNGPACGEQCHDLLAEHGRGRDDNQIDLGPDLTAVRMRRPRARRGPSPEARPFDAAEAKLRERDLPTEKKSVTALINDLHEHLTTPPWFSDDSEDRSYVIRASLDELARRGVDIESLVRDGFGPSIAGQIAVAIALPDMLRVTPMPDRGTLPDVPEAPAEWRNALLSEDLLVGDERARVDAVLSSAGRLRAWVDTAPINDVVDHIAPLRLPSGPAPDRDRTAGAWMVDRFTETYLNEWRKDALRAEWEYLHGFKVGCCPPDVMTERRLDAKDVAAAISDIAVNEWRHEDTENDQNVNVEAFTSHAIERLNNGDPQAAVAMYRSLVALKPTSATAQNNYGFCLIPEDPSLALDHLRRGQDLGFDDPVNGANQVLCLVLLGRADEAADLAAQVLAGIPESAHAYVWEPADEGLRFAGLVPLHPYVERLRLTATRSGHAG